jgi:probable Rubsico expression protein CbbX
MTVPTLPTQPTQPTQPAQPFALHRPGGSAAAQAHPDEAVAAEPLAADALIRLADDEAAARVREVLDSLDDELVGLAAVKTRIKEISSLLLVERARQQFGLATSKPTLHMSFTGPPGTGKTTVALRMAQMLHALGFLRTARVHAVTRDDLVGQFIGHTAPKTKEAIAKAAGGVLFIDEAYYLYRPENERDYGQEAIEILLQEMESERDDLVVVFAGYADRMETFFSSNPGLSSRVAHHIEFVDYERGELMQIAEGMLRRDQYRFEADAAVAFDEYLSLRMARPRFANARSVRNALERIRLRQANRLVAGGGELSRDDLMTLTEADVRLSRIFGEKDPAQSPPV